MRLWILTGAVGSGKTTRLIQWADRQPRARGILSPVLAGQRFFMHHPDGQRCLMEARTGEQSAFETPRYRFSVKAFCWAEQCLEEDLRIKPDWLLIDEIGKLELRGKGFAPILRKVLDAEAAANLVLVVRSELLELVQVEFDLDPFTEWGADPLSDSTSGQW